MAIDGFLHFTENVATGGQPTVEELIALKKEQDFRVVVNLSPYNTPNFLVAEPQVCQDNCLVYFHYPVDCSELYPWQYDYFKGLMDSLGDERKIFIHCGGNIKSSALLYIYLVKEGKMGREEALVKLKSLNRHDQKWYDYFETMSV